MSVIQRYFDDQADNYQSRSKTSFWSILRHREESAVLMALRSFPGMTCLELGCGSGYYTFVLMRLEPSRLMAVDFSYKMLSCLKIPGVLRVRADIQKFSVKTPFDRVLCAGALEFLPDPDAFFYNVKNILSPNGLLILLLPRKSLAGRIYQTFHRSHGVKIRLFDKVELNVVRNNDISPCSIFNSCF